MCIYVCIYIPLVWGWFVAGRQRENLEAGARLGKDDSIAYLEREMFDLVCREEGGREVDSVKLSLGRCFFIARRLGKSRGGSRSESGKV